MSSIIIFIKVYSFIVVFLIYDTYVQTKAHGLLQIAPSTKYLQTYKCKLLAKNSNIYYQNGIKTTLNVCMDFELRMKTWGKKMFCTCHLMILWHRIMNIKMWISITCVKMHQILTRSPQDPWQNSQTITKNSSPFQMFDHNFCIINCNIWHKTHLTLRHVVLDSETVYFIT